MCPEKRDRCVLKLFGWIDCADIFVNGERKDRIIGTPAYGMLDLKEGINEIAIEIPLTPVWSVGDNWSSVNHVTSDWYDKTTCNRFLKLVKSKRRTYGI